LRERRGPLWNIWSPFGLAAGGRAQCRSGRHPECCGRHSKQKQLFCRPTLPELLPSLQELVIRPPLPKLEDRNSFCAVLLLPSSRLQENTNIIFNYLSFRIVIYVGILVACVTVHSGRW